MKHCSINQILNAKSAGDIFSADPNIMKTEYRNYAKAYHPDVCHREDVMTTVNTLFAQAKKMLENKDWEQTNVLFFSDTTLNKRYSLHYNQMYKFEYGYYYVGDYTLIYMFKEEKPWKHYIEAVKNIKYVDSKIESYFRQFMPDIKQAGKCNKGWYVAINKDKNVYPLSEILRYFNGKVDNKHSAWITTRLNNIVCFLKTTNLVHNAITIDNLFVKPSSHGIYLLGGWWFAVKDNDKMVGCPKAVYNVMPPKTKTDKIANRTVDIESVKQITKNISKDVKPPIAEWYNTGSTDNPFDNLDKWDNALTNAYGKRRFTKMEINENEIYAG